MKEKHELIVTVVEKGHSDEVIIASREAGARGGTVIYGRGTSPKENETILGLDIKGEKEVVLILAPSDKKSAIMEQISSKAKLNTTGKGLCFSLPIDDYLGLNKESQPMQPIDNIPSPTQPNDQNSSM